MTSHRLAVFRAALVAATLAVAACAAAPPTPGPGRSTLAGRVRLVAPPAVARASGAGAYGDRRMRDVERVDYSRPGFAVVYVDAAATDATTSPAAPPSELSIVDGPVATSFEPADLAMRAPATLRVRNAGSAAHAISIPDLGLIASVEAGDVIELAIDRPGAHELHLLDRPGTAARIFATPGPYARVSDSGRFAIADLPPGRHTVHVWHPRLPPLARSIELRPDTVERVDLALGLHDLRGE